MSKMATDEEKLVYEDLKRAYDITLERRKTLTGQATSLMGFAGIIETILIGMLVTLATDHDARTELSRTAYYYPQLWFDVIGFVTYIIAIIFALLAFYEGKYYKVPQMPDKDNATKSIIEIFSDPAKNYNLKLLAIQVNYATEQNQLTNNAKHLYLKVATTFLVIGIGASAIGGLLLVFSLFQ